MKKFILVFITLILILSGCTNQKTETVSKSSEIVKETKAEKPIFIMAGKIEANDKANVTSKVPAKVTEIMVDIGSKVSKGDPLIKLDTKDLEASVKQAEAGVNAAKANLARIKSGARPEQKIQAQAALDSASKAYENAKNNYDRMNQLLQAGAISQQQFEAAESQLKAVEAQYKSAKEQMDMLNEGETKEAIDVVQAQVKQAEAALEMAKIQLDNAIIISPVSGVVSAKNINVGEMASPGIPLASIVDTDSLIINAYLPSGLVHKIKAGQEVLVKVSEVSDKIFKGKVAIVNPVIDDKGKTILVKVSLEEKNSALKPGMFAEIGLKN
ncbi:MAG: HlyD family secretion protein [Clostridiales bacterium]|nr:HlyD family secretion protein [Clostridiales bacterium]MDK2934278.1 HlyD family secretion protein [Clostridiales bacterium]